MSTLEKINKLTACRESIEVGGGETAIQKIHSDGKWTARERIEHLLDPNSFVEFGAFVKHRATDFNLTEKITPADGVITGYGTIEGRLVYVYSQDATVLGGSVGEMHAKKITNLYDQGMKMGAPIIGLLDSSGLRLQEAVDGLQAYGDLFLKQTLASGVVPQITVIFGDCAGGAAMNPSLSDFTFMVSKNARLFVNSPNTIEGLEGKKATYDTIASAKVHSEESGVAHFVYETEEECLVAVRVLTDFLPGNNLEDAPVYDGADDLNRISSELNTIIPDDGTAFDIKTIITSISDEQQFIEVHKDYAKSISVGFIRLNGYTVGVLANQSMEDEGYLGISSSKKAAQFVYFCDAFNIPLLTLTDVEGFKPSVEEEKKGIAKEISKLVYAFANATVPKINVVIRKAFGSAYVVMNSKHIGADVVLAWPTAEISVMNAEAAVNIMYEDELAKADDPVALKSEKIAVYQNMQGNAYTAGSRGYVDDIIEPAATRKRVIAALEMLLTKRDTRPAKKHSTVL